MHVKFRNVNDAFTGMVLGIHDGSMRVNTVPTRAGECMRFEEPVVVTYLEPRERVLFNPGRDCNPFFHLFESLWMLAGCGELKPLVQYNSNIATYSDDGTWLFGAYGHRWRNKFGKDQLDWIVNELKRDPFSRRVVLSMWDPGYMDTNGDQVKAASGGRDVPCNTHAYLEVEDETFVNLTVCNRSNDMIWGMFGANVVHMSFLLEYVACSLGLKVGRYHQITNNLHVYTERWTPELWLTGLNGRTMWSPKLIEYANDAEDQTVNGGLRVAPPLLVDRATFDSEVKRFIWEPFHDWKEPFLNNVAKPMCQAFAHHKARQYGLAYEALNRVQAEDWQVDGNRWIAKRERLWESKRDPTNPYHRGAACAQTSTDEE